MKAGELTIMAQTVWGEARGESFQGKLGVAYVILHRTEREPWPDTVAEVCLQPKQFSTWNEQDANRIKAMLASLNDSSYQECLLACLGAVHGQFADPTGSADHYHATSVSPSWAKGMQKTAQVGDHIYYRARP